MRPYTHYQQLVERGLRDGVDALGPPSPVRDGCVYALSSGGKRVRPVITLMVSDALDLGHNVSEVALGIEYFHTASLVADDLPSMDDDAERRGKPSVHCVLGEGEALLVSYALIASGYNAIARGVDVLSGAAGMGREKASEIGILALKTVAYNAGLCGAIGGQFLDLHPPNRSKATVLDVIHKKTASLFEIAFVYGWLFGGGSLDALSEVKEAAFSFGTAFQLADDLDDLEQDLAQKETMNAAVLFGETWVLSELKSQIERYQSALKKLKIDSPELFSIAQFF